MKKYVKNVKIGRKYMENSVRLRKIGFPQKMISDVISNGFKESAV